MGRRGQWHPDFRSHGLHHHRHRRHPCGELCWSDVDLNRNVIRVVDERASRRKKAAGIVRTTKGRRSRTVPIHRRLHVLLDNLEHKPDGWVFHALRGGRLRPRNVLEAFIKGVIEPLKSGFRRRPARSALSTVGCIAFATTFAAKRFSAAPRRVRSRSGWAMPIHAWSNTTGTWATTMRNGR